ncbi:hypothetical protein HPSMNH_1172 [Glaesserella parasuis MN-H]|nr:hypothetical protein HPSMNH_1172 [Glaesserella parasuis MN-H]
MLILIRSRKFIFRTRQMPERLVGQMVMIASTNKGHIFSPKMNGSQNTIKRER